MILMSLSLFFFRTRTTCIISCMNRDDEMRSVRRLHVSVPFYLLLCRSCDGFPEDMKGDNSKRRSDNHLMISLSSHVSNDNVDFCFFVFCSLEEFTCVKLENLKCDRLEFVEDITCWAIEVYTCVSSETEELCGRRGNEVWKERIRNQGLIW